jgi:threonine-phosphate decarboxylase
MFIVRRGMKPEEMARPALRGLPKTVHGGQAWRLGQVEDYSHNLNPFGPPSCIEDIMRSAVPDIGHYPDDSCKVLKEVLADHFAVGPENIIVGAGSSDIIRCFPNTFLGEGDKAVISRPSFAEYSQQCMIAGAEVLWNDIREEDSLRIDRSRLTSLLDMGAKAVYICNPNNPTGRIEPREKVLAIADECRSKDALLFLDETLLELVHGYRDISCATSVLEHDNMIVAGSLTKSFAIPGIRIGFAVDSEGIVSEMDKVRMTWNVGQVEQNTAISLIRDHMDYVDAAAETMAGESVRLHSELSALGFPLEAPCDSFFYFTSLRPLGIKGADFQRMMLEHGIMVRDCASFGTPFEWYVRFSVKDRARNDRFISAVAAVMQKLR